MAKFLSDEWFVKVNELTDAAGDLQIPRAMADVTVNLEVRTPAGNIEMRIDGGLIKKGYKQGADVNMSMPDDYAYKLLVMNDWNVGMRGYIKRKIQLSGNLKKMIPLQSYTPSRPTVELSRKIESVTEYEGEAAAGGSKKGESGEVKDVNVVVRKARKAKRWVADKLDRESRLCQPFTINGLELKNRMVMSPMTPVWANADETPSQREIDYWVERANGGVGLIITEVNSVDARHRYQPLSVGLHSDYQIEGHKKLVDAVHAAGARIFPQISHPGPESLAPFFDKDASGNPVPCIGPSVNRSESTGQVCRELRDDELPELIGLYGDAAFRAKKAGYDGIELHMAHNYMLLGSFLSPIRNKREEGRYCGFTREGRLQLTLDVLADIRSKVGDDFPVIVRISGDENIAGACGRDMTDTQLIAPILVEHGVNGFHVSGGVIDQLVTNIIAGANFEPGFNVPAANAIKEVVDVPVLAVGCIHDPLYAEQILREERADAIVLGRPLIADPELPRKVMEGRYDDIRRCVRCLTCVDSLMKLEDLHCAVNGRMGREKEFPLHARTGNPKRVMVVGSGPAGMEAARVAAERGHQVALYERHKRLGGALLTACTVHPDNETLLNYLMTQIKKLPIEVHLGVEVTPEIVKSVNPDVLIDASGGAVVAPRIPGDNLSHVITGTMMHKMMYGELPPYGVEKLPLYVRLGIQAGGDLMQQLITPKRIQLATKAFLPMIGKKVVVVGMDLAAIESAEFLAERGCKVSVFDTYEELAPEIGVKRTHEHVERMRRLGITLHTETQVTGITPTHVEYKPKYDSKTHRLEADTVILAGEIEPKTALFDAVKDSVPQAFAIGDCTGLGLIDKGIQEANTVVYGLG